MGTESEIIRSLLIEFYCGLTILSIFYWWVKHEFTIIRFAFAILMAFLWGYYTPIYLILSLLFTYIVNKALEDKK